MPSTPWPFEAVKNTAVFTTRQVLEGATIFYVWHNADDGAYQFLDRLHPDEADAKIVALEGICERDVSLYALADLPEGWVAWRRSPEGDWMRKPVES